ncbi:MAG: glycosyltransferase family 1 protein [Candidatus Berkelbacteria bacterium]
MLIGIDTSRTTKPKLTGTEYYSIEIIKNLAKLDQQNRYLLYAQLDPSERLGKLPSNFKTKIMPFPRLWSQVRLSWEMLWAKPDVLFVPSHTVPLIHPKNTVVTLHDLGFKHFPELYSSEELAYHNWTMNFSANHACQIITPSEFTKQDLIKTYALDPSRIHVVWHGFDKDRFKPNPSIKKQPYILFIGRIEEKKNIRNMIKAYGMLRSEVSIKHKLVLAGSPGFGYEGIKAEIAKLPQAVQEDIIETGYISEQDYIHRLQETDIFLFTTNFEGFGMPIIEAFACGTPVVTSNVSSMPEIAGNAAMLANPKKPLEIAAALSKLIHSPNLKESLILKGRVRAGLFSWEKAAHQTLEVLKKAGQND